MIRGEQLTLRLAAALWLLAITLAVLVIAGA